MIDCSVGAMDSCSTSQKRIVFIMPLLTLKMLIFSKKKPTDIHDHSFMVYSESIFGYFFVGEIKFYFFLSVNYMVPPLMPLPHTSVLFAFNGEESQIIQKLVNMVYGWPRPPISKARSVLTAALFFGMSKRRQQKNHNFFFHRVILPTFI